MYDKKKIIIRSACKSVLTISKKLKNKIKAL